VRESGVSPCKTEGHHKYECPTFQQYLNMGAPNPLGLWCEICKTWVTTLIISIDAEIPEHCEEFVLQFCKSVGHDEKDCRTLDLMRECTAYAYRVQGENEAKGGAPQFNTPRGGYNQGGRGGFKRLQERRIW
jgi:hypothetical protein